MAPLVIREDPFGVEPILTALDNRPTNDPFSGIEIENGSIALPDGIGSGLTYKPSE